MTTRIEKRVCAQMMKPKAIGVAAVFMLATVAILAQNPPPAWTGDLNEVQRVSAMIPGRKPLRVNVVKFAESRRTKNFSIHGAPADPSVQARTAFQVVYADGSVMVDAGMDQQVHRFFGRGVEEPFDSGAAREVERALQGARLIVVTHEHGDHVAGVIHTALASDLARKTVLTRAQVRTLTTAPQMPEIRLTADLARQYRVIDYDKYFPLAPGMALVNAPGHTPGSQMVYIALESGREYLLIGDAAWHMDGVRLVTGKDAPWITEDQEAIMGQLRWLNGLSRAEPNLVVVASHDEDERKELINRGILGGRLE